METTVTRADLVARAQAHIDKNGRSNVRLSIGKHYRRAVAICRAHNLATADEILTAHRNVRKVV